MKITNIPLLLSALADSYDCHVNAAEGTTAQHVPSGPAQLASIVRTVLDMHTHRLWKRRQTDQPGAGFIVTADLAEAEIAECQACGEIDPDLFWCKHVRHMFAAICDVQANVVEADQWPDLTEAIHTARRAFEKPIAAAIVRSITNPAYSAESRIALANAVLCSTPTTQESR